MKCLHTLSRPYTLSTLRNLSTTNQSETHRSHDPHKANQRAVNDVFAVEKKPVGAAEQRSNTLLEKSEAQRAHAPHKANQRAVNDVFTVDKKPVSTAEQRSNTLLEKKIQKARKPGSKVLAMSSMIPEEREIPGKMMKELKNYISDMAYKRKTYLKKLSSSKSSVSQNLRPKVDERAEHVKEDRLRIDVLLEREMNQDPEEKKRKQAAKDQAVRKHMPDSVAADVKMMSQLPSLYHISHAVVNEIRKRDRDFAPQSMLDVGGSFGSSIWAVDKYYSDTMMDYVYYDSSKPEQHLGIKLFGKYDHHIPDISFKSRKSFPYKEQFNIVSAVNYFSALLPRDQGMRLEELWNATEDYLIIAENTTGYSTKILEELRTRFCDQMEGGHIFAPCPHMNKCPLVANNGGMSCQTMFMSRLELKDFAPSNIVNNNYKHTKTKFSYLVLKKGEKSTKEAPFSRLLSKPLEMSKSRKQFQTCNSDGTMSLNHVNAKHAATLWKHLEYRREGDTISANWVNHDTKYRSIPWAPKVKKVKPIKRQKSEKDQGFFNNLQNEEDLYEGSVEEEEFLESSGDNDGKDNDQFEALSEEDKWRRIEEEDSHFEQSEEESEYNREYGYEDRGIDEELGKYEDFEAFARKDSLSQKELLELFDKYASQSEEGEMDYTQHRGGRVYDHDNMSDQYHDEQEDDFGEFLGEDGEGYDDHLELLDIIDKSR